MFRFFDTGWFYILRHGFGKVRPLNSGDMLFADNHISTTDIISISAFAFSWMKNSFKFGGTCIPDICHGPTDGVRREKICHVEKFQISVHDR